MSLDRWLEPARIDAPASAFSAYPASVGIAAPLNAENAGNAGAGPQNIKTRAAGHESPIAPENACQICGQPADDENSNTVHEYSDDLVYRRVHFTPECYDAWFKATFGKTPAPTTL